MKESRADMDLPNLDQNSFALPHVDEVPVFKPYQAAQTSDYHDLRERSQFEAASRPPNGNTCICVMGG